MACLEVTHPEIKDFIVCKHQEGKLSNFNISVKLTDKFMDNLNTPENREIMDLIVDGIWRNGEPGILFKDTIEKYNPCPENGELNPNPCGEALLSDYEACCLGSINLSNHVVDGVIDWVKLGNTVKLGVIFLNNVIDKINFHFLKLNEQ